MGWTCRRVVTSPVGLTTTTVSLCITIAVVDHQCVAITDAVFVTNRQFVSHKDTAASGHSFIRTHTWHGAVTRRSAAVAVVVKHTAPVSIDCCSRSRLHTKRATVAGQSNPFRQRDSRLAALHHVQRGAADSKTVWLE